ncbi:MAG TPA: sigma 54-interacting transcriptional regulator [Thermomicrobiales bacterium]|nr:sigma 54-interacting transcriptional regulator [Thermomicrobiales bacterium]
MTTSPPISTLAELNSSGYQTRSIRQELRDNLVTRLRDRQPLFNAIHGYETTVIPQLQNAILAGHDIILLGERGQAKTRIARTLTTLLDEWIPVIAGSEVNDDPLAPISAFGRATLAANGDATPIAWLSRDRRFSEKLATPDTTVADLIGEVDPIKVAEGRYLSNEEIISFGLIPRTNRGIFNLNELPDLAERIQVGLLNILEEQDVQIRGFQVRLPVDLLVVASANPEDYTNRGRIITPLKDRFGSQIRTHYPETVAFENTIVDQERSHPNIPGVDVLLPDFMQDIVTEISHHARRSPVVSSRSGVSVRMSVANTEAIVANAIRRALLTNERLAVPRISDLDAIQPTSMGKIEFETFGEGRDEDALDRIVNEAIRSVFLQRVDPGTLGPLVTAFDNGLVVTIGDDADAFSYIHQVSAVDGLSEVAGTLVTSNSPQEMAAAIEFVLEGLHQVRRVSRRTRSGVGTTYTA